MTHFLMPLVAHRRLFSNSCERRRVFVDSVEALDLQPLGLCPSADEACWRPESSSCGAAPPLRPSCEQERSITSADVRPPHSAAADPEETSSHAKRYFVTKTHNFCFCLQHFSVDFIQFKSLSCTLCSLSRGRSEAETSSQLQVKLPFSRVEQLPETFPYLLIK